MGLKRYRPSRVRFTWRGRHVDTDTVHREKVLRDCKNQISYGGKCLYFGVCNTVEVHHIIKTNTPCADLSWRDLEDKVTKLNRKDLDRVYKAFIILMTNGVRYEDSDSEETLKIKDFEWINMRKPEMVAYAVRHYMRKGPMVGVFKVWGHDFDAYGQTPIDGIYFANSKPVADYWTHCVTITGFGEQGRYPFWEFQNSYGPNWRGAARGFGQVYAVHLCSLFGITMPQ